MECGRAILFVVYMEMVLSCAYFQFWEVLKHESLSLLSHFSFIYIIKHLALELRDWLHKNWDTITENYGNDPRNTILNFRSRIDDIMMVKKKSDDP